MAIPGKVNLPQEVCDLCTQQLRAAPNALEFLQKCKDCGYDVDQMIDDVNQYAERARLVKAQFFPTQP